jgi:uncharacterized protein (TIGR03437 family)
LVFTTPVLFAPSSLQQTLQVSSPVATHFTVGFSAANNANWLGVTPGSGNTSATLTVVVNAVGLFPGTYTGTVQITPAGGATLAVPVTLIVTPPPTLSWSEPAINNSYLTEGPTPQPVSVNLASSSGALQYQITKSGTNTSWLSVDSSSGTTPADVTFSFDPTGLAPGVYQAVITASPQNVLSQPVTLAVTFSVRQSAPIISSIVNGASFLPGALAPGLEVVITGSSLGPLTQADAMPDGNGLYPTTLAGAQVFFNGVAAPVLHAQDGQITVLTPYEVAGSASASVVAIYRFAQSAPQSFLVADTSPGLFIAVGSQGIIFNADGSYNGPSSPANVNDVISILGTGDGQTNPSGIDGLIMQSGSLAATALPVTVTIGGVPATVMSSGSAPGQPAGIFLIQVQVPDGVSGPAVPVSVMIGDQTSQSGVTMAVASPMPSQ